MFNWGLCAILTSYGVFTDDKLDRGYNTRTDARDQIITATPWFIFPYPGMWVVYSCMY